MSAVICLSVGWRGPTSPTHTDLYKNCCWGKKKKTTVWQLVSPGVNPIAAMSRSKLRPVSEFYSETSPKRQFNEIVVVRSYDLLNQKTKNSLPPFLMYLVFFWRVKFLRCGAAPLCCFNKTEHEAPIVSTKPTTHNYNKCTKLTADYL